MDAVEILTREKAVPQNVLPTGRRVGTVHSRGVGLYELKYVDGKAGELPAEYAGRYTGIQSAERDLRKLVNDFWDISDRASKKK